MEYMIKVNKVGNNIATFTGVVGDKFALYIKALELAEEMLLNACGFECVGDIVATCGDHTSRYIKGFATEHIEKR